MRILLIANTLPHTDISGVGEQVVQLAAGLESMGHEVEIVGRGAPGAPGPKLLFPVAVIPAFLRAVRRLRPHVVQVHESDGALVALVTRTLQATLEPVPRIVALLQVSYLEEMRAVRSLRAEGRVLGRPGLREWVFRSLKAPLHAIFGCLTVWLADEVLAPSRRTAEEIERDYLTSSVKVLPNVTGARDPEDRPLEGLPDPGYLLFVGRLRIRKGVEVLLHAVARIRQQQPQLRVVIVGDGEHLKRLRATALRLGLQDQVQFLGRCAPGQVPHLMSGARALVVPSIYEGMPLVILEAMGAGLPVVASRVSGIPEVVMDGESGWLVAPRDITGLAEALRDVYERPLEARRRGEVGRQWVREAAAPGVAAKRWAELVD